MATIREIAEKAGVSVTTVSRVLNMDETISVSDETRVNIFNIAEELDYVPRKSRKAQAETKLSEEAKEIAVVYWYNYEEEIEDPYYLSLRLSIEERAKEYGYSCHTVNAGHLTELSGKEACIIMLGRFTAEFTDGLKSRCDKIIVVDNDLRPSEFDHACADFGTAATEVMEYLYELGHKNIVHLGGRIYNPATNWENFEDARDTAYENFMRKKGIYDESRVWDIGPYSIRGAYKFVTEKLSQGDIPTAIFASSDNLAIGAYRAISEAGLRIPEDISVVSFNDQPNAKYMAPPLSSVKIPTKYIGYAAVDLFNDSERMPREFSKVSLIHYTFKKRKSCGPARKN